LLNMSESISHPVLRKSWYNRVTMQETSEETLYTPTENMYQRFVSLTKTTGFKKYFKNTGWMFFAKVASMLVSFIATSYIARNLGPTNYGELSYAISFVSIFSFIAALGIDQILYRDLIKYPEKVNDYMGSAIILRTITSAIAIALCLLFAFVLSPKDVSFFLIFIICISFLFNTFQIIGLEFQAHSQAKIPSLISLGITIILNILKIVVIAFDKGVIYLALILLLESILYAVGLFIYRTKIYGSTREWRFNKGIAKDILSNSWPLIFSSAFAIIYARIDQIMIKNMLGAESVGLYDAAVRLSEVWYFIPTLVISSLFPAIVNAHKTSLAQYYSRSRKLILFLFLFSSGTALLTYVFAPYIVYIVFGTGFLGAVPLLKIYIWSNIATALNAFTLNYLVIENKRKTIFISSFVGMALNVILNIILIPQYGSVGSAIATLISYSSLFLFIFTVKGSKNIFYKYA